MTQKDIERFWRQVKKSVGCWIWTGAITKQRGGYGQFNIRGKVLRAHRISFELHFGPIPKGILVCHTCDVPRCVKPSHLFLGTCKDNAQDAWQKGRLPLPKNAPIGESHHSAKMTFAQVKAARKAHAKGTSNAELAQKYKVSPTAMSRTLRCLKWKTV